jgi:hypothetical protein
MGLNCCDICKSFEFCMKQPDEIGIDDFGEHYYERAACRFGSADEYFNHLATLGGDAE